MATGADSPVRKNFLMVLAFCGMILVLWIFMTKEITIVKIYEPYACSHCPTGAFTPNFVPTVGTYGGNNVSFLVNTVSCRIPDLDPMDPSVRDVVGSPKRFKCDKFPTLAYQRDQNLFLDWKAIKASKYKNDISHCTIREIIRPVNNKTNKNSWKVLSESPPFKDNITVGGEFIHMKCYNSKNKVSYENYYMFAIEKESVEKRCKENQSNRKKKSPDVIEPLNVMIIGLDSVSRLNSIRFMKKTREYLFKELDAVELAGYNKVGDNTIHNMSPFLMGKYLSELPWDDKKQVIFDNFKLIWDEYADMGYRTLFQEDFPEGAIFDYKKPGFHKTPTDYYDRPFHLAFNDESKYWYMEQNCFMDSSQTDIVIDYTSRFMSKFKSKPYFGFVFITRLTHDYLERTAMADDIYIKFLKNAHKEGSLNNTVLIFMSDHGIRFGNIRNRYIGKMEERLPMMFVVLPKWFHKKYPEASKNLRINSRRLTTPFDMHETLRHLHSFDGKPRRPSAQKPRAYSILDTIPENRSCTDASIESHWCTCSQLESVDTKNTDIQNSAKFLVETINNYLKPAIKLCEVSSLDSVETAYKIIPSSKELSKLYQGYQVTVRVKPGGGIFEGTILLDKKGSSHRLSSDVSRINMYGHQKRCNVDYKLEKMCYCK